MTDDRIRNNSESWAGRAEKEEDSRARVHIPASKPLR